MTLIFWKIHLSEHWNVQKLLAYIKQPKQLF